MLHHPSESAQSAFIIIKLLCLIFRKLHPSDVVFVRSICQKWSTKHQKNKEHWNVHTHKQESTETFHLKFLNIKTHSIWLAAQHVFAFHAAAFPMFFFLCKHAIGHIWPLRSHLLQSQNFMTGLMQTCYIIPISLCFVHKKHQNSNLLVMPQLLIPANCQNWFTSISQKVLSTHDL